MGTAGKMVRAQEAINKAGTLAEAQAVLENLIAEEQDVADIFYTQQQSIESLTDVLRSQEKEVFIPPPQPVPKQPNFLMFIGIGIAVLFFLRKGK